MESDLYSTIWILVCIAFISFFMFNEAVRGGVDVATAKVRNLYSRASRNWGLSTFSDLELSDAEKSRNIRSFQGAHVGGLYNEGNTCFMNSVIQALASCDPVADYVDKYKDDVNFSGGLSDIIVNLNQIHTRQHGYGTLKLMRQIGGNQRWSRYHQEDAQEFFQELLTTLENDKKNTEANEVNDSPQSSALEKDAGEEGTKSEAAAPKLMTPFDGSFAVRVGCLSCGDMEGIRQGVISSVDLSLGVDTKPTSVKNLLKEYVAMETISEVECYRCTLNNYKKELRMKLESSAVQNNEVLAAAFAKRIEEVDKVLANRVIEDSAYNKLKCMQFRVTVNKSKQTMFAQPSPDVLMIHINRSAFDLQTGIVRKNFASVDFPTLLDLAEFIVDPNDPTNADPHYPMHGSGKTDIYDLKAVVIHYGSANFGHYISFRKFHGLWWRISDDQVDLTTESQVLGAQGVFMLFYEKRGASKRPEFPVVSTFSNEEEAADASEDHADQDYNDEEFEAGNNKNETENTGVIEQEDECKVTSDTNHSRNTSVDLSAALTQDQI